MANLFGPEQFATSFTSPPPPPAVPSSYESSTFAGSYSGPSLGPPKTGHPYIACCEQIGVTVGTGPSGENIVDKTSTHYYNSGATWLAFGPLAAGQFDCRSTGGSGIVTLQMDVKLLAAAVADAAYGSFTIVAGGTSSALSDGTGGQTRNNDYVVYVEYFQDSGADVQWNVYYYHPFGATFGKVELNGGLTLAPYTFDDAWHRLKVKFAPATVTGAWDGVGGSGSGSAASDGSVEFSIDGAVILSATGIDIVVNRYATTNPAVYYARGFWLGDGGFAAGADLIGPTTNLSMFYGSSTPVTTTTRPTPTMVVPTPCCDSTNPSTSPIEPNAGPIIPPTAPTWIPRCAGGGSVPTQADIVNSEDWAA